MGALSENLAIDLREPGLHPCPVDGGSHIFQGALVAWNAAGYLVPASDVAGLEFAGIATEEADNTDGDDGDKVCLVDMRRQFPAAGTGFTQADVGSPAYCTNDATVATSSTHGICCGRIVAVESATRCWVDRARGLTVPLAQVALTQQEAATPSTPGNTNGEIAALTFTALGATGAEVEALRDKCEELADDFRSDHAVLVAVVAGLKTLGLFKNPA